MIRRVTVVVVLAALTVWAAGGVAAQETTPDPEPTRPVPAERGSARASMTTFLESFYDEPPDLARAASCLDMSDLAPEVRAVMGRELAATLKDTLDRTIVVDLEDLPKEPDAPPYAVLMVPEGEIVLAPTADGEWLFSRRTVASIDALHERVEGRPVLAGVGRPAPEAVSPASRIRSLVPASLRGDLLGLELWQWLGMLAIILAGTILGRIFSTLATVVIARLLERRATVIDRDATLHAVRPLGALVTLVVWGLGILWLGLPMRFFLLYYRAVKAAAVVVAVLSAYRVVDVFSDVLTRRAEATDTPYDDMLVPLLRKSAKVFIVAAGLLTVAQVIGTDLTALLASVGIGGLALALAAQDTVSNFFGSLTVFIDRPFKVGDWVVVGDVEGTVEEVGFRSTRIRTFYNSLITLPNSNLIKASVDNLGDRTYRRWSTRMGIAYDTPPEKIDAFCDGIRELVRRHPYTRKDYFHVYFNEFGSDSLQILLYVFFAAPDWATELRERHRLGVDILRLAAELGVEFAFPTQTLYVRQQDWAPPTAAGDGYPEASENLRRQARRTAGELLERTVAGRVPGPVRFDAPTEQDGGDA